MCIRGSVQLNFIQSAPPQGEAPKCTIAGGVLGIKSLTFGDLANRNFVVRRRGDCPMEMDRCHFWLGLFQDRAQIDEYLREKYGDDDEPISLFAADQGELFYDHDWVSVEWSGNGSLEELLQKWSVPEAAARTIKDVANKRGIRCNALFVANQDEFDNPASVHNDSYAVEYVGCYDLWRKEI
jgi:hypothetical protein